jgi:hypothetical protein
MIQKEEFLSLAKNQIIALPNGESATIQGNFPTKPGFTDIPGPREIIIRYSDGYTAEYGWGPYGIMDEDWGIDVDLNHRDSYIMPL